MDVSSDKTPADDHNTNQNEATLTCKTAHGNDGLSKCPIVLESLENVCKVSDSDNGSRDTVNTGMCNIVTSLINPPQSDNNSTEHAFMVEPPVEQGGKVESIDVRDDSVSRCEGSRDPTTNGPSDSPRLQTVITPKPQTTPNTSVTISENSAVDLSVTSDDDIKVTCRCSSTPVNYSVNKTLNDVDCSMSSVGDASPISSIDIESKMATRQQLPNNSPDSCKNTAKHHTRTDNNMVFIQPPMYSSKSNDKKNQQQTEQDYSSRGSPYHVDRSQTPNFQPNYSSPSIRPYTASPYDYPNFIESPCTYNDYHLCGQRSLTDVKTRLDMQQMSVSPQPDLCCYPVPPNGMSERDYFVYPSIYVSNAGLISVLLRNDMSVEMTVDRTIRVVSHNHMMAVATDSKGSASSLYHPAVKIFQMGYNTDIATDMFRAKMSQGEAIFFSNGINCFKLQDSELQPVGPIKFSDIHRDQSVNLLFSSEGYGESLVATCMQVAAQAEYANLPKGGVIVRINGVKVTQSGCGDVTVVTGAKFIRLSPQNGTTRLGNRFVDIEVGRDWSVNLTRGAHSFINTKKRTMVCNGKMEAGFDENNSLKVINLQPRHPLLSEPNIIRRSGKRIARTPPPNMSTCFTPRRRVVASGGRGGVNTC